MVRYRCDLRKVRYSWPLLMDLKVGASVFALVPSSLGPRHSRNRAQNACADGMPSEKFHAFKGFSVQKGRDHKKASNSNRYSVLSIGSSMRSTRILSVWALTLPLCSKRNSSDVHQVTVLLGEHQSDRNAHVAQQLLSPVQ